MSSSKYRQLAIELLGSEGVKHQPLGLPEYDWSSGSMELIAPKFLTGDFDSETDQRLAVTVCGLVPFLTAEDWDRLDASERIPWMKQAIKCRDNPPPADKPAKGKPGRKGNVPRNGKIK